MSIKFEMPDPNKLLLQKDFPGKEQENQKITKSNIEDQDYLLASSFTDCTGLIASAPTTENEIDSYEQIQHFLPPGYTSKTGDEEENFKIWN